MAWAQGTHVVKKGDTVFSISRQYSVSQADILKANPGLKVDKLKVGQKINLPDNSPALEPKSTNPPAAPVVSTNKPLPEPDEPPAPNTRRSYTVKKGETLSKIARENQVTVSRLRQINGLSSDMIRSGQVIFLEEGKTQKTPPPEPVDPMSRVGLPEPVTTDAKTNKPRDPAYVFVSKIKTQIDAPSRLRQWEYIVVHHSGTPSGNASIFNYYHLHTRGMENGLAYHFVIGNGTDSGDGEIEVGPRWTKQLQGGHLASDYLNEIAIGICLVGDFNEKRPSARQIASLVELINYLALKCRAPRPKFKLHREINPRPTDCPGKFFPAGPMHQLFG